MEVREFKLLHAVHDNASATQVPGSGEISVLLAIYL